MEKQYYKASKEVSKFITEWDQTLFDGDEVYSIPVFFVKVPGDDNLFEVVSQAEMKVRAMDAIAKMVKKRNE